MVAHMETLAAVADQEAVAVRQAALVAPLLLGKVMQAAMVGLEAEHIILVVAVVVQVPLAQMDQVTQMDQAG